MRQIKTKFLAGIIILNLFTIARAQVKIQTVRGSIIDKISQQALPGATVIILNTDPLLGATTDENGNFKISNVPLGKYSIKVNYIGYKPSLMQNIQVNAGKELILNLNIEEDTKQMDVVEVVAKVDKNKAQNTMSVVSTRTFSVEETQKFAAAVNDPARMATSYAGVVSAAGDGNNLISIRGNSPNGLLWRMEGVEIPNPNHFSSVGSSGGGISILSAQLLGNSDFSTGAFASEYGNALSGVFDLKLRKGNNEKREYTFQAGFLGVDASTEGYFKKGYQGSYLINYRYSTLGLISKMGVKIGDASTIFQDLSYNIYLPTKRLGNFTIFGFGGLSNQTFISNKDSVLWKENPNKQYEMRFAANTGATGITHTKLFDNQSYLKTIIAFSGTANNQDIDKLTNTYQFAPESKENFLQNKVTLSSVYTQKLNARSSIRAGVILNSLGFGLSKKDNRDTNIVLERIKADGRTESLQTFCQLNYKPIEKLTMNVGLHYNQLMLNHSYSLEPRASVRYDISSRHNITAGYGLHSQIQPIGVYFAKLLLVDESNVLPNRSLDLSKAHHFILGYDFNVDEFSHIKLEAYYQDLYNIPVSNSINSTFSLINNQDGFVSRPLVNSGLGKNFGLELTYERFLNKGLYYLLSASLYDSKYKAPNSKWYNTMYNSNYASTFTIGKEWQLSEKGKGRIIGVNLKSVLIGGTRYTPIDLEASINSGYTEYNYSKSFEAQNPAYYRLDARISSKRNYKNITTILALDIQNTTNRKNVFGSYYDKASSSIKYYYQSPLIPVLSYKLEF
jgi:hypothetical protein